MPAIPALIPIYTTRGDVAAFMAYPYLYSRSGEWIGLVTPQREVYSVHGHYVGELTKEPRILRKMSDSYDRPRRPITERPPIRIKIPATVPLAPMMAELAYGMIDVLLDDPELLPSVDFGDLREDMD
jgi:hypothetical protein